MNLLRYGFMFVNSDKGDYVSSRLPKPEDFSKALFTLDIGQNDIAAAIRKKSIEFQQVTVPNIVSQFTAQIRVSSRVNHFHLFLGSRGYWVLYNKGARTFWIHNTGPIGCLPISTIKFRDPPPGYLDEHGCIESQNDMARHFNKQLKVEIVKLRTELSAAAIVYVDMYRAKYELISNAKNEGNFYQHATEV
ncbi:GDSL esterase/lipase At5g14450-like [Olea europaea var. sylvestris]|uniref:GDSL esterase/lipase At5g14450-like n=1 Tax=Olea europaea var. sylvestris TaxID=158386 RepID=UPI000C1D1F67|nr:GDSL esterase/lipase At5g14450-like [Olea europaea var. sylvestris]